VSTGAPSLRVLGPLEVVGVGGPVPLGARQQVLLAVLLAHRNHPVSASVLMDAAWDGEHRTGALHTQISRLRRLLDDTGVPATIETSGAGYCLRVDPSEVDADRFHALCDRAGDEDPETAASLLGEGLRLWRGTAYGDLAQLAGVEGEAVHLSERQLAATESKAEALIASGRPERAVPELQAFVAAHPLREEASGSLMRALYLTGRQSEALRHYQSHRERLGEELGIEPSVGLQRLEREILQQEVLGSAPPPPAPRAPSPIDALEVAYLRRTDGAAIAHATLGEGPSVVSVPAWVTNLELVGAGRDPRSSLLERLAQRVRLTMYDRLGTGLSPGSVDDFSLDATADELISVLEHTGASALLAVSQAGPAAIRAAAERPDLVTHVVLLGTFASATHTFPDERTARASLELLRANWGLGSRLLAGLYRPRASDDVVEHLARVMRESATREVAAGYLEEMFRTDVSALLPSVAAPALVMHYTDDKVIPFAGGQQLAVGLPDAVFVPLTGRYHLPDVRDLDRIVDSIVDFVSPQR
jgi:DNA-binding SARP family transcriptional activator/pimeloyl-ACP methyl ester carboxylesterase